MREARDPAGRFLIRQAVTSKGANLTILVRRATSQIVDEEEFVDGAFAFHDGKFLSPYQYKYILRRLVSVPRSRKNCGGRQAGRHLNVLSKKWGLISRRQKTNKHDYFF